MLFHNRRQSRDIALYQHIMEVIKGKKLLMNDYSAKLFSEEQKEHIIVQNNFLEIASENDYCFVENTVVLDYQNNIQKIILYRWNRTYPADTYFQFPLDQNKWKLEKTTDIKGNSHDIITEEVYTNE
nr:ribonuclease Z [Clostridium sp. MD294]